MSESKRGGAHARDEFVRAYDELFAWCHARDFAGHDPFDALNSPLFRATPFNHSRLARLAWTQLFKRAPVNLRALARVPHERNAKGIALFALAALARFRSTRTRTDEQTARELLEQLLSLSLTGWHGAAWGYNFDWQGRMQSWSNDTEARFDLARQVYFGFGFNGGYERLFEEEFGAKRADGRAGAFWGSPERATNRVIFSAYGGATPSQKYSANFYASYTRNAFDYDFGAGPRFPRVSPAALSDPNAALDPGVGDQLFLSASLNYQPTVALRTSVDYVKSSLKRADTGRTAFDENLFTLRTTYQFTSFTFARARLDYDTLASDIRGEFLLGWTPRPGTAFYIGYNNDLSRNGYNTLTNRFEPGLLRNSQTFFIKLSYLFRRSY